MISRILWLLFKKSRRKKTRKNKLFITGILLDTSRNYFTVEVLKRLIDGMSYNKLNVFHWHITDTARFTFNSILFWTSLLNWRFLESRICTRPCWSKVLSHSHFLNFKSFCHQAAKPFWRPFLTIIAYIVRINLFLASRWFWPAFQNLLSGALTPDSKCTHLQTSETWYTNLIDRNSLKTEFMKDPN